MGGAGKGIVTTTIEITRHTRVTLTFGGNQWRQKPRRAKKGRGTTKKESMEGSGEAGGKNKKAPQIGDTPEKTPVDGGGGEKKARGEVERLDWTSIGGLGVR